MLGKPHPHLPPSSLEGISGTWIPPVINNTATTDYTFTPNLTLHPTAEEVDLRIVINEWIVPTFDSVDPICAGDSLAPLPTTSLNGITGTWSPALNNTMTTEYTFTPDDLMLPPPGLNISGNFHPCTTTQTLTIVVNPIVTPDFAPIDPICAGDPISTLAHNVFKWDYRDMESSAR